MNRRWRATVIATTVVLVPLAVWISLHNVRFAPPAWEQSKKNSRPLDHPAVASRQSSHDPSAVDPTIVDYVGSDACRDCHHDIWRKYQSHPMANSFTKLGTGTDVEDYTQRTEITPPGNRRYRAERNGTGVWHHEIMVDQAGGVIYDQAVPIQYAIGSGKRGRAFVIDRDGLLFKSSISWYSDRKAFGLSPDYFPEKHPRFERRITGGCVACHSGLPNFIRGATDRFGNPPFLEEAIGCERCHGPGRRHIAAQESSQIENDPIVNPAKLDLARREAVCAQCHLHGELRVLRTGRSPHDFRPGERLDANWIIFIKSHGTGLTRSGRAASQVEHMVSSVCFQKSEGRMGCTSCHDPHALPDASTKSDYFRQRCLKCHESKGCSLPLTERALPSVLDDCVRCHMPSVPSDNILHRSVADHRILRQPVNDEEEGTGASRLFQFDDVPVPELEIVRAKAIKMLDEAAGPPVRVELANEASQLLLSLIDKSPADPELYIAMGNSCQLRNQPKEATHWRLRALQLNSQDEVTLQNMATVFHDYYQLGPAETYLKRFLEVNPWHGSFHGRLAGTLMQRGDTAGAIASAERALELNPTLWRLHAFLSEAYTKTGNLGAAKMHRELLARKRAADASPESDRNR